ncbi:MAG: transmembrane protein [Trebouxia sp. A1-2]|nr:MAG: transmembrane protein [Trebouxia sp. A1-2]
MKANMHPNLHILHRQVPSVANFGVHQQRQHVGRRSTVCTCKAGGRWLEAAVQSTAGRPLSVQLGSIASSVQPTEELEVFKRGVQGAMLEPSVANKNWVRLLAVSVAVLAAARFSPAYLSSKALGFVHLIAFGTFLGTNIWTTFVAGLTMFKNLPRQTFGKLQSKLFPKYFALLSTAMAVCLGTMTFAPGAVLPRGQLISLGVALGTTVVNWLWVEPVNTKLMFDRYALENDKGSRDEAKITQVVQIMQGQEAGIMWQLERASLPSLTQTDLSQNNETDAVVSQLALKQWPLLKALSIGAGVHVGMFQSLGKTDWSKSQALSVEQADIAETDVVDKTSVTVTGGHGYKRKQLMLIDSAMIDSEADLPLLTWLHRPWGSTIVSVNSSESQLGSEAFDLLSKAKFPALSTLILSHTGTLMDGHNSF